MYRKIASGIIGIVLLLPIISLSASDSEKSYHFADFSVDIKVQENSRVIIEEYETLDFTGSFSFITREIPYQGEMEIENIEVFDQKDNHKLTAKEAEITDTGYSKQITLHFTALNEKKTWLIKYTVRNVINYFGDYDEIYWNVVPDDRDVIIDNVQATIILPKEVEDILQIKQTIYAGAYGDKTQSSNYKIADNRTLVYSGANIAPYTNFTIVAGFPKGIVAKPAKFKVTSEPSGADIYIDNQKTYFATPYEFYIGSEEILTPGEHQLRIEKMGYQTSQSTIKVQDKIAGETNAVLGITLWYRIIKIAIYTLLALYIASPLLLFLLLLRHWYKVGRDPAGRGTIVPQYEAYKKDPPGIVGTLLDESADLQDITSSIIDLAVRGYIKIIEKEKNKFSIGKIKDWQGAKLYSYETDILNSIFADKAKVEVALTDLNCKLYTKVPQWRDLLYQEVLNAKYFERDPAKVRKKYYGWGIACLIFGLMGIFAFFLGIPLIANSIILFIFAGRMPKRTIEGVAAQEWNLGFKMFLYHADRYRIAKMTPEIFERCLPYALVFNVAETWAKNFEGIYTKPPTWYQGQGSYALNTWSLMAFTSTLSNSFTPNLRSTINSRPQSSGSSHGSNWRGAAGGFSGFGGGGFSGGGFGGGGFRAG